MKATIRLATAQPARVAARVLESLSGSPAPPRPGPEAAGPPRPVESPEGTASFSPPDGLEIEGSAGWIARGFEATQAALDLPPRMRVELALPSCPGPGEAPPEVEGRLWSFARIVAARHAHRARFEVLFGDLVQMASAWLSGGLDELRRQVRLDRPELPVGLSGFRIPVGPGDSSLVLDLEAATARLDARDAAALDALELAAAALLDQPGFRLAQATFMEASATPSEAAERERSEVASQNVERRTGYLLAADEPALDEKVRRLGPARVRTLLEGSHALGLPPRVRSEALALVPAPGRARALVRLLVECGEDPDVPARNWLDRLAEEPEPAAVAGFEELLASGFQPQETARRLSRLDPVRAERALIRVCLAADEPVRAALRPQVQALGAERVASAIPELPATRAGLEGCFELVSGLDGAGPAVSSLVRRLFEAAVRLAVGDPAARYLTGRIAEFRGDVDGALVEYQRAAEESGDSRLAARARIASARLALGRGRIEDALSTLVKVARTAPAPESDGAVAAMGECFARVGLAEIGVRCRSRPEGEERADLLDLVTAWLESRAGHYREAVEILRRLDAARPLSGEAARMFAAMLRAVSDDPAAVALLERVAGQTRDDIETRYQLARIHHELGDSVSGLRPLEEALQVDPGYARALHLKGLIHEKQGQHEEAARCYERAIRAAGDLSSAYSGLARAYVATRRYQEAADVYRRSLEVAPECRLPAFRELGGLYEEHLQDPEQALYWYQRYLTQGGEDQAVLGRLSSLAGKVSLYPRSAGTAGS